MAAFYQIAQNGGCIHLLIIQHQKNPELTVFKFLSKQYNI